MDYGASDSSGTDDDLPPTHQNRVARATGRLSLNGRSSGGPGPYMRMQIDMDFHIHELEKDAYRAVIMAFNAQSDAITWAKEGLMSELRKELRVSDEEHRELLGKVNKDDQLRRIREWRQGVGSQGGLANAAAPSHDAIPSPSVSASRKKQKISHMFPLSAGVQTAHNHLSIGASAQPSSSAGKRGAPVGAKNKKSKVNQNPQQMQPAATMPGRGSVSARGGPLGSTEPEAGAPESLLGQRVKTRWPEDNTFYEAVITEYNKETGLHALVYDMNTSRETWEWVNLKEMSPSDIIWSSDGTAGAGRGNRGGGRGTKKLGRGGSVSGRGRGVIKGQPRKDLGSLQNGSGKKHAGDIEILHTETLLKEVERIVGGPHPDPADIEKAKKVLKEHEQSLLDAIAKLSEASEGESGDEQNPLPSNTHSIEGDRGWRNRQYIRNNNAGDDGYDTVGDGRAEGSDEEPIMGEGGVASDYPHDGDDGDDDI